MMKRCQNCGAPYEPRCSYCGYLERRVSPTPDAGYGYVTRVEGERLDQLVVYDDRGGVLSRYQLTDAGQKFALRVGAQGTGPR